MNRYIVMTQPADGHPPCWWSDLHGGHPVILITQGTVSTDFGDLIVPSINGLKDQPMLVVAVPFNKELLREIPSNVRIEPFVPFDLLFPHSEFPDEF